MHTPANTYAEGNRSCGHWAGCCWAATSSISRSEWSYWYAWSGLVSLQRSGRNPTLVCTKAGWWHPHQSWRPSSSSGRIHTTDPPPKSVGGPWTGWGHHIEGDPLAPHPQAHISNPLLSRPGIGIKFHGYLRVEFSHGGHRWCLAPVSYLHLEVRELIMPQLDLPLSEEWPSLDGLEALLMLGTLESMVVKIRVSWLGSAGAFSNGVLPGSLCGELSQGHFMQKQTFKKSVYKEMPF